MAANISLQDLQNISVRFNQLSDDVKKQILEEQLKILNNDPRGQPSTAANAATSPSNAQLSQVQPSQSAIALAWRAIVLAVVLAFSLATIGVIFIAISPIWIKPTGTLNSDI
jgi:hypothetical protein